MSKFTEAVARELEGLASLSVGVAGQCCPLCESDGRGEYEDEGAFMARPCDSCGSHLAGDRWVAHAWEEGDDPKTADIHHLYVCVDCLHYHANGEEPDTWEA